MHVSRDASSNCEIKATSRHPNRNESGGAARMCDGDIGPSQ
jgi:hypothetical protein